MVKHFCLCGSVRIFAQTPWPCAVFRTDGRLAALDPGGAATVGLLGEVAPAPR